MNFTQYTYSKDSKDEILEVLRYSSNIKVSVHILNLKNIYAIYIFYDINILNYEMKLGMTHVAII